jgi:hypothetical protein
MHRLSYTKSRCLTNTPARIGARRRHLQGVPSQMLTSQHVKCLHTTVRPCVAEMVSDCDEDVLIVQRSAAYYYLYILEEINYRLTAVNDSYLSFLSCVYSLVLKYVKLKM